MFYDEVQTKEDLIEFIKETFNQEVPALGVEPLDEWIPDIAFAISEMKKRVEVVQRKSPDFIFKVDQIKEKFGGLRFYVSWDNCNDDSDSCFWLGVLYARVMQLEDKFLP